MPIRNDLNAEAILARFKARKPAASRNEPRPPGKSDAEAVLLKLDARVSAAGIGPHGAGTDSVEISLSTNMTVEAANGIVMDSVVEQINRAIQEAGIDLTVGGGTPPSGQDASPEAAAGRIVAFAGGFLPAYESSHAPESARARIQGFMTLIRGSIQDGFQQARDFLEGVTKLSDTIDENISRTFELTSQYLEAFHQNQIDLIDAAAAAPDGRSVEESDTTPEDVS